MTDWADVVPSPLGVSYRNSLHGIHSVGAIAGSFGSLASAAYPVENAAFYFPFRLMAPTRITGFFVHNGTTVSGNLDLGIYNKDGVRLASTGSTAQSGTNSIQTINLGTPIRLGVEQYYLAIAMNNTTGTLYCQTITNPIGIVLGLAYQTSAFPLPATATFATIANARIITMGFISLEG